MPDPLRITIDLEIGEPDPETGLRNLKKWRTSGHETVGDLSLVGWALREILQKSREHHELAVPGGHYDGVPPRLM